jgi:hypothetical protein
MRTRRPIALLPAVAVAALMAIAAPACSSSSSTASPTFTKGVTVFFTADGGHAPKLPSSFVNCVSGKLPAGDRTTIGTLTSSSDSAKLPDAAGVRLTRAADQCDANLTNQLIEASAFAGAPSSISAAQKTCATGKIISGLAGLDDSKLKGSNTNTVQTAVQNALKACGVSLGG